MKTLTLGQGFKVLERKGLVKAALIVDESKVTRDSDVKYKSSRKLIQSSHTTLQDLSASLNLSVNVSNIAPELRAGFARELRSNGVNSYLVLTFTSIEYTTKLKTGNYTVSPEATERMNEGLPEFYQQFGGGVVGSISYGTELTAIIQLKNQTIVNDSNVDVKGSVKAGFAEASSEFHALLQEIDNSQVANIFYYVSGSAKPQLTLTENINDLYTIIDLLKKKSQTEIEAEKEKSKQIAAEKKAKVEQDKAKGTKGEKQDDKTIDLAKSVSKFQPQPEDAAVNIKTTPVQVEYEIEDYAEVFAGEAAEKLKRKILADRKLLDKIAECHQILGSYDELIEYALNNRALFNTTSKYIDELIAKRKDISVYSNQLQDMASNITQNPFMDNKVLKQKVSEVNEIINAINTFKTNLLHLNDSAFLVAEFPAHYSKEFNGKQHAHRASHYKDMHLPPHTSSLQFEVVEVDAGGKENIADGVEFKLKQRRPFIGKVLHNKLESGKGSAPLANETYQSVYVADLKKPQDADNAEQATVRVYAKTGKNFPIISQLVSDNLLSLNADLPVPSFYQRAASKVESKHKTDLQKTDDAVMQSLESESISSLQETIQVNYMEALSAKEQQVPKP